MGSARNNWLAAGDPLRGIAAFGVVLFHAATWAVLTENGSIAPDDLGPAGHVLFNLDVGVFLFFLLSGYLIGRPFASAFVLQTPFPRIGRYLWRRVLRLAPGALAAAVFALVAFGGHYAEGTVHLWTLSAEACFYAALPLPAAAALPLARRISGPRMRSACWAAGCLLIAVASVWFRAHGGAFDFQHQHVFPSVAFAFAPGLALAGLEPIVSPLVRARPAAAATGSALALALMVLMLTAYFAAPRERFVVHSLLAVLAAALLMTAVLVRDWAGSPAWRTLNARPVRWIGKRSYSLYLFHFTAVVLLTRHLGAAGAVLSIPVSLVLAWAGYALVERPFMPRRQREDLPALKRNPATIDVSPV
jgi:peptidoglycan/LPS O-acetylase OafA/YrhL